MNPKINWQISDLRKFCGILLLVFIGFASDRLLAVDYIPPMPTDLEHTKLSVLTVGLGNEIYARYGHTMIRVEDPSHQLDYLVNWGIFEFNDPYFVPKFFRGILIYRMGFGPTNGTIRYYRDVEKRSITSDDLILTTTQKKKLLEKIIWNAQPQNLYYPYQYFRNNCATIPRDYLDEVLNGSIKRAFENSKTELTYRDYVKSNLSDNPFVFWGLDVIFNGDNDHKISKWQEMFYPIKLAEHLATLPSVSDDGVPNLAVPLLTNHKVIVDIPPPNGDGFSGYLMTWLVSGVPLLLVCIFMFWNRHKGVTMVSKWHFRVFGLVSIWWGLTHGFFGLTHFSGWAFSSHTDLHGNINILLFWPVDMLVLIPGVQLGILGRKFDFNSSFGIGFWQKFAKIHIILMPIYTFIAMSGFFAQYTTRVVIYMVPLSLLYYLVMSQLIKATRQQC